MLFLIEADVGLKSFNGFIEKQVFSVFSKLYSTMTQCELSIFTAVSKRNIKFDDITKEGYNTRSVRR